MSEEEKKAIERVKRLLQFNLANPFLDDEADDIVTLLNLIEKQNNRLEELEKELEPIHKMGIPVEVLLSEFNRLENLEDDIDCLKYRTNELTERYKLKVKQMCEYRDENYIPKSMIREKKNKFLEDRKNETVFMTQSSQINASLISFCDELLGEEI